MKEYPYFVEYRFSSKYEKELKKAGIENAPAKWQRWDLESDRPDFQFDSFEKAFAAIEKSWAREFLIGLGDFEDGFQIYTRNKKSNNTPDGCEIRIRTKAPPIDWSIGLENLMSK